jgi:hypothetical protein
MRTGSESFPLSRARALAFASAIISRELEAQAGRVKQLLFQAVAGIAPPQWFVELRFGRAIPEFSLGAHGPAEVKNLDQFWSDVYATARAGRGTYMIISIAYPAPSQVATYTKAYVVVPRPGWIQSMTG